MDTAVATACFDYAGIDPAIAEELRQAAKRIHKHGAAQNEAITAIGSELNRVKDRLDHGQFGQWISAEFAMSQDTAERYMAVASRLGDKIRSLRNLPKTTLYLLAAERTPEPVREEILHQAEAGEVSREIVEGRIYQAIEEERQRERKAAEREWKTRRKEQDRRSAAAQKGAATRQAKAKAEQEQYRAERAQQEAEARQHLDAVLEMLNTTFSDEQLHKFVKHLEQLPFGTSLDYEMAKARPDLFPDPDAENDSDAEFDEPPAEAATVTEPTKPPSDTPPPEQSAPAPSAGPANGNGAAVEIEGGKPTADLYSLIAEKSDSAQDYAVLWFDLEDRSQHPKGPPQKRGEDTWEFQQKVLALSKDDPAIVAFDEHPRVAKIRQRCEQKYKRAA